MNLLAFDTSTDTLSIAVQHGEGVWQHQGPGGAQASAALIPAARALMAQDEWQQQCLQHAGALAAAPPDQA